ncbi:MAG: hypothetical protein NE327_18410 [Lentisphaeraceae bacterium]|nr:hypothetical protein [Lentisphaeraceae bacterium]
MNIEEIEDMELGLFFEAVYQVYGYDFRNYAHAHLLRRLKQRLTLSGLQSISELQHKVLRDPDFFRIILGDCSIKVSEMFRDPEVFKAIRSDIIPLLSSWPQPVIWLIGSAGGEEAYSLAILLEEYGIYDKCRLIISDLNEDYLEDSKKGRFTLKSMQVNIRNYFAAGGTAELTTYYTTDGGVAVMKEELKRKMEFMKHNIAQESYSFEAQLILCRNVLIYFNSKLQDTALNTISQSLSRGGYLVLGVKEILRDKKCADQFSTFSSTHRIYKKCTQH